MNTPICQVDLRSGILCPSCQKNLDTGKVTQLDLDIMKALLQFEDRFPELKDLNYVKTAQTAHFTVLLVSGQNVSPGLIPKVGAELKKRIGLNIRIVEKTGSIKRLLEQILAPIRIAGMNTIWLPDGTRESSITMSHYEARRMPAEPESLEKLVRELSGETVRIQIR